MKNMTKALTISSAIATGLLMAGTSVAHEKNDKLEKCYGIAKANKNDCAVKSQGTSCAGQVKKDGVADAWIYVPAGTCEKIVGGSTTPKP